jgi:hypothetical protein
MTWTPTTTYADAIEQSRQRYQPREEPTSGEAFTTAISAAQQAELDEIERRKRAAEKPQQRSMF